MFDNGDKDQMRSCKITRQVSESKFILEGVSVKVCLEIISTLTM